MHKKIMLKAVIERKIYQVCSLGFNINEKNEFFYHFMYPKNTKKRFWNHNTQSETGRPCHISWHEDGRVHLKLKKDNFIKEYQLPDKSFLSENSNSITPLLVHSIYSHNKEYCLPLEVMSKGINNAYISQTIFESELPINYSIILILAPELQSLDSIFNSFYTDISISGSKHRLHGSLICQEDNCSGKVLAWKGWAIHVIKTDLFIKIPLNTFPDPYFSSFAYYDLSFVLNDFLVQRFNQIGLNNLIQERR